MKPPFDVPFHLAPLLEASLENAGLLLCYECNRQDFIDDAGLHYVDIIKDKNNADALSRPGFDVHGGFAFFCNDLRNAFDVATTTRRVPALENGQSVNVFSAFLLRHLPVPSFQQLMTPDGLKRYSSGLESLTELVWYVAIEAFESGVEDWQVADIAKAKKRRQQLLDRRRELYCSTI